MTSEDEKRLLILAAIVRLGGNAPKKKVLDEIVGADLIKFTDYDLQIRKSRNELNWRNDFAFVRFHLVRDKYLSSELSSWAITESGQQQLFVLGEIASQQKELQHIKQPALEIILETARGIVLSDEAAITGETISTEGTQKQRWTTTYERDKNLRVAAINIHGTTCKACHFDFETRYGSIGIGFIEVHHIKPVSSLGGPTQVNPTTDLVVLCSNCHSIVHRKKGEPLSIEDLCETLKAKS